MQSNVYRIGDHVGRKEGTHITLFQLLEALESPKLLSVDRTRVLWESFDDIFTDKSNQLISIIFNEGISWENKYTLFWYLSRDGFPGIKNPTYANQISLLYSGYKLSGTGPNNEFSEALRIFPQEIPIFLTRWNTIWGPSLQKLGASETDILTMRVKIQGHLSENSSISNNSSGGNILHLPHR